MAGGTVADYNGLFKEAYADAIEDLVPDEALLVKGTKFLGNKQMLGDLFNQPVIVRNEQGFTYSKPNNGAFAINTPTTMVMRNASVNGFSILARSGIDYESFSKASNAQSFRDSVDLVMENVMDSFGNRLEMTMLYGQSSTGLGGITAAANGTATTAVITFATGQWSTGLWTVLEGANINAFLSTAAGAALNTTAPLVVTSIDVANKQITVTGASADITAVKAGVTAGSLLRFYVVGDTGAGLNEAVGLDAIALNTGTLFGIDAGVYSLWKANTSAVGGNLTLASIQQGIATAVARGLSEEIDVFVNPVTWKFLSTEQVAYRMLDSSYSSSKVKNGFEAIEFYSQNGKISVYAHKFVKEGEAYALPLNRAVRVGATDITFNIPGTDSGKIFQQSANNAGFEFRVYSNQALLVTKPATLIKFTGITNA
jgi:hypothetical protein